MLSNSITTGEIDGRRIENGSQSADINTGGDLRECAASGSDSHSHSLNSSESEWE